jgi:hypothetical protein
MRRPLRGCRKSRWYNGQIGSAKVGKILGSKVETQELFSYVSPEQRVPQDDPLRAIRAIVDRSLAEMDSHFSTMYSTYGRPSILPEFLLRALRL